jgi:hypothetical protein
VHKVPVQRTSLVLNALFFGKKQIADALMLLFRVRLDHFGDQTVVSVVARRWDSASKSAA